MRHASSLLALGFLATAACGGATFSYGGDGGPGSDSGADAPPSPPPPPPADGGGGPDANPDDGGLVHQCPTAEPGVGTTCSDEGLECEYGDAWWSVSCDAVLQCSAGSWSKTQPSYEPCTAEPGKNPAACPANYASVNQGAACAATGTDCYYDVAMCSCQVPLGGPVLLDAGMTGYWGCLPGQGCPYPRPRLGSACSQEGTSCMYEECSYGQTCTNGAWQGQPAACAGAAQP